MRIRSILPKFWESEDVGRMDWDTRLVFIGLWSYVDDNGVGRDVEALIAADLFPFDLSRDSRETLARVASGLQTLSAGCQIVRYKVAGQPLLLVSRWDDYQRVDRPNKERYPRPTTENADPRETLARPSRDPRETLATGEGEKGRRGEVTCAPADAEREFETWYLAYPRKRAKGQAAKAYRTARKTTDAETLLAAITAQAPSLIAQGADFIPYPATWLNGRRWLDEITAVQGRRVVVAANGVQQEVTW